MGKDYFTFLSLTSVVFLVSLLCLYLGSMGKGVPLNTAVFNIGEEGSISYECNGETLIELTVFSGSFNEGISF